MTYSPFQNYYGHDTTFIKRLTVEAYQEEIQLEEKELSGGVPLADHTNRKKDAYQFQKRRQALTSSQAKQSVSFSSKYPTYDYLGRELCVKYQMLENSMTETRRQQTQCDSEQHKQKICINTEIELDGKQSKVLSVRRTTQGGRKEENPECEYHWEESHQTANTTNHNNNIRFSRLSINTNSYHAPLQQQTHHNSQRSFSFYRDSRKTVLNKNLRDSSHPEGEEEEEENENNVKRLCDDKPAVVVEEKEKFVKKETPTVQNTSTNEKEEEEDGLLLLLQNGEARTTQQLFRNTTALRRSTIGTLSSGNTNTIEYPKPINTNSILVQNHQNNNNIIRAADVMSDVNYNLNAILPSIEIHLSESTKEGNENHNSNTKKFKSPFQDYGGYFATIAQNHNNTNTNPFSFPAELHIGLQIRLPHKDYTYCPAEVDRCTTVYTLTHFYPLADIYEAEEVQENSSKEEEGAPAPKKQILLYTWRTTGAPNTVDGIVNEAKRAAIGLFFLCPSLTVKGFEYVSTTPNTDNNSKNSVWIGGVTLVEVPVTARVSPLSQSYPYLLNYSFQEKEQEDHRTLMGLKLVLKMLIALLSRRVVHGDLRTTEGLFLLEHNNSDTNNNNNSAVLCFHWENFMDFNVFVDRNVGRSIYYQTESVVNGDVVSSLLFHGKDVETLLEYFLLEHATYDEKEETTEGDSQKKTKFTTLLNTNQYFQLNKLLSLTREQTQMINYILVINNCLKSIPSL